MGRERSRGETEERCRLDLGSWGLGLASEKNLVQEQSQRDIGGADEPPRPAPRSFLISLRNWPRLSQDFSESK